MDHDSTERANPGLRSTRRSAGARAFLVLAAVSTLLILHGTAFPFDLRFGAEALQRGWDQAHPLPWRGQTDGRPSFSDLAANVLLFLPWGIWLAGDAARRGRSLLPTLLRTFALGLGLSISVEIVQLFSPTRLPAGSDVVANGLGALLGAWIGWTMAGPVFERHADHWKSAWRSDPIRGAAWVMVGLVVLAGIAPFQPVLGERSLAASLESSRWLPFAGITGEGATGPSAWSRLSEVLWWSLAAGVFATVWRARGRRSWFAGTFVATTGLALAVESLQLLFVGPALDVDSVLAAAVGALLALAVLRMEGEGSPRTTVAMGLGVWLLAVAAGGLSPESSRVAEAGLAGLVPFWTVLREARVWALVEALARMLAFVPLGVGIFLLAPGTDGRWAAAGAVLAMAALEGLTSLMLGRAPDMTDAALAGAGVWLSLWVLRETASVLELGVDRLSAEC